jgi:hypothetical protein
VAFIIVEDESYGFKDEDNYRWMLVATATLAVSVTFSLIYLIFYCISLRTEKVLRNIDWNLQLLTIYVLVFVFLEAEMSLYPIRFGDSSLTVMQLFMYITISIYVISLVLGQYDSQRNTVWWISFVFLLLLFIIDFFFLASHR